MSKEAHQYQAIRTGEAPEQFGQSEGTVVAMNQGGRDRPEHFRMARWEAARYWLTQGVHLVPIHSRAKSLVAGFGPYRDHITTEQTARYWFAESACNLGVVCGTGAEGQLVVGDFDEVQAYEQWRARVGLAADTLTEKTARGIHVFYFSPDAPSGVGQGVEVKGRGTVVMVAPSIHPSGVIYQRLNDFPVAHVESAARLFPLLSEQPEKHLSREGSAARREAAQPIVGEDVIARIKSAVSVRTLASELTTLQSSDGGQGRWFAGRCPFHEDKNPSFWIDAERGLWGCRAPGCPTNVDGMRAHDVINFFAWAQDIDEREAIRRLAAEYLSA